MALVVLVAVPLSGWVASEGGPLSTQAGHGIVGGVIYHLKREDDEAETKEIAELHPSPEEREQAREHLEGVHLEQTQAAEQEQRQQEPS
jgi:glutamate synthase domain-containing protein 3